MTYDPPALTLYEAERLHEVQRILRKKPEAVLKYYAGLVLNTTEQRALIALSLSALVNVTKEKLEVMRMAVAIAAFVQPTKENDDDETRDN